MVFAELGERRTTIHLSLGSPTWCHQQSLFQCAKSLTLNISEPGRRQRPRPDPHPRPTLLTKTPSSFFTGSWQETWQHRYRDTSCQAKVTQSRLLKRSDHQRRQQDSLTSVLRQQNPQCLLCTAPPVLNTSVGFPENHTPATTEGGGELPPLNCYRAGMKTPHTSFSSGPHSGFKGTVTISLRLSSKGPYLLCIGRSQAGRRRVHRPS